MLASAFISTFAFAAFVSASPTGITVERIPGVQYASHVKAFMPSRSHNQLARRGGGGGGLPTTSDFPSATTTSVAPTGTGLCDNVAQKKGKLLYWGGPVIKNVEVSGNIIDELMLILL